MVQIRTLNVKQNLQVNFKVYNLLRQGTNISDKECNNGYINRYTDTDRESKAKI